MANEDERDLALHYIDKVHATLIETGRSTNTIFIAELLCSFVVISLSIGVVSADKEISFSGFKFISAPWLLIIGGTWLSTLLFIYYVGSMQQEARLKTLMLKLYESVGFKHESMYDRTLTPYALPDFYEIVIGTLPIKTSGIATLIDMFIELTVFALFVVVPIITILVAAYRTMILYGAVWWVFGSFSLLLILSIRYLVVAFKIWWQGPAWPQAT